MINHVKSTLLRNTVISVIQRRISMRPFWSFVLFVVVCLAGLGLFRMESDAAQGEEHIEFSFSPGEVLRYNVRWGVIPAAHATLEVHPMVELDGRLAHHFVMTTRTNSFADYFYRYRNHIDSFTDIDMSRSLNFNKREEERSRRRNVDVHFNWTRGVAQVTENGRTRDGAELVNGTFDPLSIFYVFRSRPLHVGAELSVPVSDGKKLVHGVAKVVAREEISIEGRVFDCFIVEPDLKDLGGVFQKSPDAALQIWVTADESRLPVRVRSKVVVGYFTAELDLET
ncbi:Protein of unknown function [Desulfonatronum thiosulfatophilum]|uniref:DUF3108 domain-containing protein n=1 Tax=Desulfonatronum thiosulfatophilum TaxID=617002 RepID=A0A1G6CH23_9BACT|nr:DUF3108 domain-containing protein [Desulfonatronum thiosulfatophilum]SDB32204.1 Protein of unknown function [Desulfonatronum thiosulfatophilum]